MAIAAFGFSLLGTFLVRSGIITSVHAFASDPGRGYFILVLLGLALLVPLLLFAWRAPILKPGGLFSPISREGSLILNNLLLVSLAVTVLLGTLYPLALEITTGDMVSVGWPFYHATFVPLAAPLVILAGIGPFLGWKRGDLRGAMERLAIAAGLAFAAALAALAIRQAFDILAAFGIALGTWLVVASLLEWAGRINVRSRDIKIILRRAWHLPRAAYGMMAAHFGLGIAIIGMTASSAWKDEIVGNLALGQALTLAGYEFRLDSVAPVRGENYKAERAMISVIKHDEIVLRLQPERRSYLVQPMPTTEAAIHTGLTGDLYAVLGEKDTSGNWAIRLYYEPLVAWIWAGAALMIIGGAISFSDRRYRTGAPARFVSPPVAEKTKA